MVHLIKRTGIVFIIIIVLSFLIAIFGIFKPMKAEIEDMLLENFELVATSKIQSLMTVIDRSIQGAQSLSSRTMIKNKIVDYRSGMVTFSELAAYTEEKYCEGVEALGDVIFARRYVDGQVVCAVDYCAGMYEIPSLSETPDRLEVDVFKMDDVAFLHVVSPILDGGKAVGYDSIFYNFDEMLETLNDEMITIKLLDASFVDPQTVSLDQPYEVGQAIFYVQQISTNTFVSVSMPKNELMKSTQSLNQVIAYRMIAGYLLLLLIVYLLVVKSADTKIKDLTSDRDNYKFYANQDPMTGAYSRLFLEEWVPQCFPETFQLILIDLDDFKSINDQFGHATGDEVLKLVVQVFKDVIREEDFIVRYGGDEFILLARSIDPETAKRMVHRIKKELWATNPFHFRIHFSYGISQLEPTDDIYEIIKHADQIMYENKRLKKAN